MQPGSRILEKAILSYIDGLVSIIIELSIKTGENKKLLFDQAVTLVKELSPLLLNLAGAREEHVEALIRQLVTQKLPQGPVMKSFGDLHHDLSCILAVAFHTPESIVTEGSMEPAGETEVKNEITALDEEVDQDKVTASAVFEDMAKDDLVVEAATDAIPQVPAANSPLELEQILRQVYPGEDIQRDYYFRGLCLHYYLPLQRLGILINRTLSQRHTTLYNTLLKKENIRILELGSRELESTVLLLRRLRRL